MTLLLLLRARAAAPPTGNVTLTYVGSGTAPSGTALPATGNLTATPNLPTMTDGDLVLVAVGSKPDTAGIIVSDAAWNLVGPATGGTGVQGAGTGPVRETWYSRTKDPSWSTMPDFTLDATGNCLWAHAYVIRADVAATYDIAMASGARTVESTAWSVTCDADPGFAAGDMVLFGSALALGSLTTTAEAISAPGVTFATATEVAEPKTTRNNDVGGFTAETTVTAGTSTGAPTVTATMSAAIGATGVSTVVRVRGVAVSAPTTVSIPLVQDDSVGATDGLSLARGAVLPTDSAGATDGLSLARGAVLPTDSSGAQDSTSRALGAVLPTDSAGATDALVLARGLVLPITDDAGATDSITIDVTKAITVGDSAGATDALARDWGATLPTDSSGATDSTSRALGAVLPTDDAGATDSLIVDVGKSITIDDNATTSLAPVINLVKNPSFEVDLAFGANSWVASSLATIARVTTNSFVGTASLECTVVTAGIVDAALSPTGTNAIPIDPSKTYVSTAYVNPNRTQNMRNRVQWLGPTGLSLGITNPGFVSAPAGSWTRLTYVATPNPQAAFARTLSGSSGTALVGDVTLLDGVMFHEGTTVLPYFDGDSAGDQWSGTPHNSTSIQPGPTDSIALTLDLGREVTDSAGSADSIRLDIGRGITDSAGANDTLARSQDQVLPTDSAGATDSITIDVTKAITVGDSAGATDGLSLARGAVLPTDSSGAQDSTSRALGAVLPTDSAGATDSLIIDVGKLLTFDENAGVTDNLVKALGKTQADPAGATDSLARAQGKVLPTDSAGVSDNVTVDITKSITVNDSAGVTDSTSRVLARAQVVTDSAGSTDSIVIEFARQLDLADSAGSIDQFLLDLVIGTSTSAPPERSIRVAAETRLIIVVHEVRDTMVRPEDRDTMVRPEDRQITAHAADRILEFR